jgi:hypothetical protein
MHGTTLDSYRAGLAQNLESVTGARLGPHRVHRRRQRIAQGSAAKSRRRGLPRGCLMGCIGPSGTAPTMWHLPMRVEEC